MIVNAFPETFDKKRVTFQRLKLPLIVKISPNMQNITTRFWIDIFAKKILCVKILHADGVVNIVSRTMN